MKKPLAALATVAISGLVLVAPAVAEQVRIERTGTEVTVQATLKTGVKAKVTPATGVRPSEIRVSGEGVSINGIVVDIPPLPPIPIGPNVIPDPDAILGDLPPTDSAIVAHVVARVQERLPASDHEVGDIVDKLPV